eukprot:UN25204
MEPYSISFGIVRNPFDRMLSWYKYCHKIHGFNPPVKQCNKARSYNILNKESFSAWIKWLYTEAPFEIDHGFDTYEWFMWTEFDYFYDENNSRQLLVDFIIRKETMLEDWN